VKFLGIRESDPHSQPIGIETRFDLFAGGTTDFSTTDNNAGSLANAPDRRRQQDIGADSDAWFGHEIQLSTIISPVHQADTGRTRAEDRVTHHIGSPPGMPRNRFPPNIRLGSPVPQAPIRFVSAVL